MLTRGTAASASVFTRLLWRFAALQLACHLCLVRAVDTPCAAQVEKIPPLVSYYAYYLDDAVLSKDEDSASSRVAG